MQKIELSKIVSDRFSDNEEDEGIRTTPVSVNVASIRCFTPRKDNRRGTRLTFTDGGGFAVTEAYDVVKELVATN